MTITRKTAIPDEIVSALPDHYTNNLVRYGISKSKLPPFANAYGTFTQSRGPSSEYPLGVNAKFVANDGKTVIEKRWGYVQPDKSVPGWCAAARYLSHPDKCNFATLQTPKAFYSDLPVGTDIRPILREQGYQVGI
jgi:hypothetical protein